MQDIILASQNAGKINEFKQLLGKINEFKQLLTTVPLRIIPQQQLGIAEVVEDGLSFVENALLKARHAAQASGLAAIADDSGLEVDALAGAPGIYSARYAGKHGDSAANIEKLLLDLKDIADGDRQARFHAVIVYMRHALDPTPIICQGSWEGRILRQTRGDNGFGYDPVFWVDSHQCSAAELDPAVKNKISHRGQALEALLAQLHRGPQSKA